MLDLQKQTIFCKFVLYNGKFWCIRSILTYVVYFLPFLSYLGGSKSVSTRLSNADTMKIPIPEAIASSNGNNHAYYE